MYGQYCFFEYNEIYKITTNMDHSPIDNTHTCITSASQDFLKDTGFKNTRKGEGFYLTNYE